MHHLLLVIGRKWSDFGRCMKIIYLNDVSTCLTHSPCCGRLWARSQQVSVLSLSRTTWPTCHDFNWKLTSRTPHLENQSSYHHHNWIIFTQKLTRRDALSLLNRWSRVCMLSCFINFLPGRFIWEKQITEPINWHTNDLDQVIVNGAKGTGNEHQQLRSTPPKFVNPKPRPAKQFNNGGKWVLIYGRQIMMKRLTDVLFCPGSIIWV